MLETKKAHELDIVELTEDLPEFGLRRGEQGTVVEAFEHPEEAYMIEFVDESDASSRIAYGVKPNQITNIDAIAKDSFNTGIKALDKGEFVEALRSFRKAANLIPSYVRVLHNSLAQSIGPHEDWDKFIFAMQLVRLIDPDYEIARDNLTIAYLNSGVQEAKNGKYEESIRFFHAALGIEAAPEIIALVKENIAASYTAFGMRAFHNGDIQGALAHFRSARFFASNEVTRQNFGKAHFHYADFCSRAGNLEMAIDSYQRAEDAGLMLPEVLNNHACALANSGQFLGAIMVLETAHNLAPTDEIIKSNLSKLLKINQVSAPNKEIMPRDFVTEDIKLDFLIHTMNTVNLRLSV
ncbi:MAG TPA: DUF4926 domain-containing protein [Pyrinomonadaceae bacterium]|nr:DUF4926 domain-containing protein [Pyrinomonadaceae bacterium]